MEKPAETNIELHDLIKRRWSPRSFSSRLVEREKLLSIMEAARWAPSCFNEQPWHFIVATKDSPEEFDRMLSCLAEANRVWAKNVPVLIITAARLYFDHNGKENRWAWHDVGLAVENMALQALSMGIFVHQMAGFNSDRTKIVYDIPEGHEPVTAIALGYPGEPEALPEELRARELLVRERKKVESFVFGGRWGDQAGFLSETSS